MGEDRENGVEYSKSIGLTAQQKQVVDQVWKYKLRQTPMDADVPTRGEVIMQLVEEAGYREFLPEAQV